MRFRLFAWLVVILSAVLGTLNGWTSIFSGDKHHTILATIDNATWLIILMLLKPEWFKAEKR
jgi:hypothetical protein